jgi:2-C-methyl-D-erythritol 2,4-cyclodiphosphate synthase
MNFRVGQGLDVHKLVPGRPLVLGGVTIPFECGLEGHSDADVLVHAVCDALLGAAALGDIGLHFPDTDPAYRGIDSLVLLAETGALVAAAGYTIGNIDAVVIAQAPRLAPYREQMRTTLADTLGLAPGQVSVKATTTEGLGLFGREEGIGALSTVLIQKV